MSTVIVDGPDGPEKVHFVESEDTPETRKRMTTLLESPQRKWPWPTFIVGLVVGVAVALSFAHVRWDLQRGGYRGDYLFKIDRWTGTVWRFHQPTNEWRMTTDAKGKTLSEQIDDAARDAAAKDPYQGLGTPAKP